MKPNRSVHTASNSALMTSEDASDQSDFFIAFVLLDYFELWKKESEQCLFLHIYIAGVSSKRHSMYYIGFSP